MIKPKTWRISLSVNLAVIKAKVEVKGKISQKRKPSSRKKKLDNKFLPFGGGLITHKSSPQEDYICSTE